MSGFQRVAPQSPYTQAMQRPNALLNAGNGPVFRAPQVATQRRGTLAERAKNTLGDILVSAGFGRANANRAAGYVVDYSPLGAVEGFQQGTKQTARGAQRGSLGETLGGVLQAALSVGVPGAGGRAVKAGEEAVSRGIRAYHGSPHDFDKFSLSKIGTGEGAQAYGHGLYFAENEATARMYRQQLAAKQAAVGGINDELTRLAEDRVRLEDLIFSAPQGSPEVRAANEALRAAERRTRELRQAQQGRMYEVNINADPNSLLDWDAPIATQAPTVIEGVRSVLGSNPNFDLRNFETFARNATGANVGLFDPKRVETLRDAGVPGLRYLDQGSRGAGDGTRNYVIFDENLIDIIRKYGLVPPALLAGGYAMQSQPAEAQTR